MSMPVQTLDSTLTVTSAPTCPLTTAHAAIAAAALHSVHGTLLDGEHQRATPARLARALQMLTPPKFDPAQFRQRIDGAEFAHVEFRTTTHRG